MALEAKLNGCTVVDNSKATAYQLDHISMPGRSHISRFDPRSYTKCQSNSVGGWATVKNSRQIGPISEARGFGDRNRIGIHITFDDISPSLGKTWSLLYNLTLGTWSWDDAANGGRDL